MNAPDPFWNHTNLNACTFSILQSNNLFVYTINNPIRWIDPSGMVIELVGTEEERNQLLELLQMLTRDTLTMDRAGVPWNRRYVVNFTAVDGNFLSYGTELIRSLINHSRTVTIQSYIPDLNSVAWGWSHVLSYGGPFRRSVVNFNLISNPNTLVTHTGLHADATLETIPAHITMGHELIHALRHLDRTSLRNEYGLGLNTTRGMVIRSLVPLEELHTIGLVYQCLVTFRWRDPTGITENALRREHGLPMRLRW